MASTMGTPLADDYLSRFREALGQPAYAILLFALARFEALVLTENKGMLGVFSSSGLSMRTEDLGREVRVVLLLE